MSTATTINSGSSPADGIAAAHRPVRVWPIAILLAVFWTFIYFHHRVEMTMFPRFMSRMIAYGVLLLGFLVWWFSQRSIRRRDRWLALGLYIAAMIVAALLADRTMNLFAMWMSSMPLVLTGWIGWAWLARNFTPAVQRSGFCVMLVVILGYFALLRWDGLRGDQTAQFSWRWTSTPEQELLAARSHDSTARTEPRRGINDAPWKFQPGDWGEFRGPNRDGVILDAHLATDWKSHPPREIWKRRVGPGWSSLIVIDGHIVTQEQRGEMEDVVAYNAATGDEEWVHEDKTRFYEGLSGAGPRGTPTFADGRIYAFGATGRLNCLDAATGEPRWTHDVAEENAATLPQWGLSVSPLVVDGMVVVYAGGEGDKDLAAYTADSGELAWSASAGAQSYSSPQVVMLAGVRQIVMQSDTALHGFNIDDGKLLWEHPNVGMTLPMLQPHLVGDIRLLVQSGQDFVLVEFQREGEKWTTSDVWTTNDFESSFNDFVIHENHVFGLRDGILRCADLSTGKMKWKKGRYGHGQLMLAADDGLLLVLGESGDVTLVRANPARSEVLASFHSIDGKSWNHPVLAQGRLYVRNDEEMACYELPSGEATAADQQ